MTEMAGGGAPGGWQRSICDPGWWAQGCLPNNDSPSRSSVRWFPGSVFYFTLKKKV